ncbi:MAG: precorrin-2 C(20)-methyltransferase [Desulfococcaceae bacterium]|jgi:precorrin-2/cobalt-factor-2 C20-methyltransferase|nr:precorrin-2 C(20)-methyltransferase [Desulfococcaceae bacterium]
MNENNGTLYGIGVGPGDPELIPLKSVRILKEVDTVFAASSSKNQYSLAVRIAQNHIPEGTPIRMLDFPMTKDRQETEAAWLRHARSIIEYLESGKSAAFITLGDSTTYSTYGYILKNVRKLAPHLKIETIPGITSYQAASARLNIPLTEGEESLFVTSGVKGGDHLRSLHPKPENVVFLKAYKNAGDICNALEEGGYLESSVGICSCGLEDEEIIRDIREFRKRPPEYWTIIIGKKNKF